MTFIITPSLAYMMLHKGALILWFELWLKLFARWGIPSVLTLGHCGGGVVDTRMLTEFFLGMKLFRSTAINFWVCFGTWQQRRKMRMYLGYWFWRGISVCASKLPQNWFSKVNTHGLHYLLIPEVRFKMLSTN